MNAGAWARLLGGALLLAAAVTAQARIDPLKRCTMTLSPAAIDYGQISLRQSTLTRQAGIALPPRTLFLNLVCPQPINLTMLFHAPSLDPRRYDLGGAGAYTLRVHDVRVDGLPTLIGLVIVPGEPPSTPAHTVPSRSSSSDVTKSWPTSGYRVSSTPFQLARPANVPIQSVPWRSRSSAITVSFDKLNGPGDVLV